MLYFTDCEDVNRLDRAKGFVTTPETKAYLLFLSEAQTSTKSEGVLIENALDHIVEVYTKLLLNFMKPNQVRDRDVTNDNSLCHLTTESIVICEEARILVDSSNMSAGRRRCFNFYYIAAKQMQERFNMTSPVLSGLRILQPREGKNTASGVFG